MNPHLRRLQAEPIPIEALYEGESLTGAVRARAELLHEIMREVDPHWGEPPYDPERVAAALGVPIRDAGILGDQDAMVIPRGRDRYLIVRNERVRCAGRRVFTTAHELMHLTFSDISGNVRHRVDEGVRNRALQELERLCDLGAAEFVMPAARFDADVEGLGAGAGAVPALAARYAVSLEAAGLRLLQRARPSPVAVGIFEYGVRPSLRRGRRQPEPEPGSAGPDSRKPGRPRRNGGNGGGQEVPQYRARRVFMAPGEPFLFPRGKSVPAASCIHRASVRRRELENEETYVLGRTRMTLKVSAFPVTDQDVPSEPPLVCAVFSR